MVWVGLMISMLGMLYRLVSAGWFVCEVFMLFGLSFGLLLHVCLVCLWFSMVDISALCTI